jgi:hypothetical protein
MSQSQREANNASSEATSLHESGRVSAEEMAQM